jgi:hypothetical protein
MDKGRDGMMGMCDAGRQTRSKKGRMKERYPIYR